MSLRTPALASGVAIAVLALAIAGEPASLAGGPAWRWPAAFAGTATPASETAEKEAFEAAKELGTIEAWEAFLTNYPTGFHADLARAYVKKLAGSAAPAAPAAAPAAAQAPAAAPVTAAAPTNVTVTSPAQELACDQVPTLRSQASEVPATIVFVNGSGEGRSIAWLDFNGASKTYARLEGGQQLSQPTYLTHPWLVLDDAGGCRQVFLAQGGTSIAVLEPATIGPAASGGTAAPADAEEDSATPAAKSVAKKKPAKKSKAEISAAQSCKELGLAFKNGQCVAKTSKDKARVKAQKKKGCPKGTYLNPLGVCQPNETGG